MERGKGMVKYILKRLLLMVMVFLIIISICFVLVKLLPNKPAEQFGKDMALIEMRPGGAGLQQAHSGAICNFPEKVAAGL